MQLLLTIGAVLFAAILAVRVLRLERGARVRSQARVAALAAIIHPPGDGRVAPVFADRTSVLADGHLPLRLGLGSVALLVLLATGLLLRFTYQPADAADAPAAASPSLALMSMQHERRAETLTVTGRVRNQSQAPADRITAVVAVFDKQGRAVATADAPIDRQALAPDDESAFHVAVPHVTDVERYRVSFRNDTGVVRHVDRRSPLAEQPPTVASR